MASEGCSDFVFQTVIDCEDELILGERFRTMLIFNENFFEGVNVIVNDFLRKVINPLFDGL